MSIPRCVNCSIVATLVVLCVTFGLNTASAQQRGLPVDIDGIEVLTRGPVHEAFAETVTFDTEPGLVAPKAPPEAIEELPPDQRPEGTNVAWIPGYWAWDDERTDFLWVSGIWRALPPGRQWVPGYWGRADQGAQQGAQWTSGYWADVNASEFEYLPEPPASVENGPNINAPSADTIWLPGCWIWQQNRYVWRPGYWANGQADWDWVPAHYVWTPRGYVFVDGYYDYSVNRRGVLFAPVYFSSHVHTQNGFTYSPVTVINSSVFTNHLFLRPSYGHYYFGDYYGSTYASNGYHPWFSYNSGNSGYDPFYAQQRWQQRNVPQWQPNLEANFAQLQQHEEARPPRTWSDQKARTSSANHTSRQNNAVIASLDELAKFKEQSIRLQTLDPTERQQIIQRKNEFYQFRQQRQTLENQAAAQSTDRSSSKPADKSAEKSAKKGSDQSKPNREFQRGKGKLPISPIVANSPNPDKSQIPPTRPEAPKPDSQIKPKQKKPRGNGGSL